MVKRKNCKGDVPVTILVIGVFAICTLALVSFYASSLKVEKSFVSLQLLDKLNSKVDEKSFYELNGFSEEQIKRFLNEGDFQWDGKIYYIEKTKEKIEYLITLRKEKFIFSAEYSP